MQRHLDRADFEVTRLKERLADAEAAAAAAAERSAALEKEGRALQELLHKRDREKREEKRRADDAADQVRGLGLGAQGGEGGLFPSKSLRSQPPIIPFFDSFPVSLISPSPPFALFSIC